MPLNSSAGKDRQEAEPGKLYVVATPVGNLNDITLRAIVILKSVDVIAAEDTRRTGILLKAHHIDTRLISCHEHNEKQRAPKLIEKLKKGASAALVSDAGTPTVSDPGYRLVRAAVTAGISVVPIPGVSAAMAALSVSGLPTDAFVFIGFPEKRAARRLKQLSGLADRRETLVFYESPRRITGLLKAVIECMGDRPAVLAREMTKQYEEFIRGPVSRIIAELEPRGGVKGECTLLVAGHLEEEQADTGEVKTEIARQLASGAVGTAEISRQVVRKFHLSRKEAYALVLEVKAQDGR